MADEFRGKMGKMEEDEVEAFLASDTLARLACLKPDGSPYVIPIWYQWDGKDFWFVGRERAADDGLERDGPADLTVTRTVNDAHAAARALVEKLVVAE